MTDKRIVLTVEFADRKVTLEGPEDFVRNQMARLQSRSADDVAANALHGQPANDVRRQHTERDLVAEKKPKGHPEIAAVLAFYMTEAGTRQFSDEEMKRAYIRAGVRPPKVIAQALRDAKNKYDYLESGDKRGLYQLSDHGERLVRFDLPRPEGR
jgi:hypothetical protein